MMELFGMTYFNMRVHWTKIFAIMVLLTMISCTASIILIKKSDNVRVDSTIKGVDSLKFKNKVEVMPIKVKGDK